MSNLKILIVSEHTDSIQELSSLLKNFELSHLDTVANITEATELLNLHRDYSLAILDSSNQDGNLWAEALLDKVYERQSRSCGILILSEHPNVAWASDLIHRRKIYPFILRDIVRSEAFVDQIRHTLLHARLHHAEEKWSETARFNIALDNRTHLSGELTSPERNSLFFDQFESNGRKADPFDDLLRRANNIDSLFSEDSRPSAWREEVKSIGCTLFDLLFENSNTGEELFASQTRFSPRDLWIQIRIFGEDLGVPFELLHDQRDFLVLNHMLTRRYIHKKNNRSQKPYPFHKLIQDLSIRNEPLCILLVAGKTNRACVEVDSLANRIRTEMSDVGITCIPKVLKGDAATNVELRRELSTGGYHMFHYAGHSEFNDDAPEQSVLFLGDGTTLTANELFDVVNQSESLHFAYVGGCRTAYSSVQHKQGDFQGVLEALAKADVPNILAFRWKILDESASEFALNFYESLFRTFLPAEALLEARRKSATSKKGRNDDIWAAPVLVMQNV